MWSSLDGFSSQMNNNKASKESAEVVFCMKITPLEIRESLSLNYYT